MHAHLAAHAAHHSASLSQILHSPAVGVAAVVVLLFCLPSMFGRKARA